jgi:hypothetical protein
MVIMHLRASGTEKPGSRVVAEAGRGGRHGRGGRGGGGGGGRGGGRGGSGANKPRIRLGKYEFKEWKRLSEDEIDLKPPLRRSGKPLLLKRLKKRNRNQTSTLATTLARTRTRSATDSSMATTALTMVSSLPTTTHFLNRSASGLAQDLQGHALYGPVKA